MAVAPQRHVVEAIEISAAGIVVEMLPPSADDLQRLPVRDTEIASQPCLAGLQSLLMIWRHSRKMSGGNSQNKIRIGRKAQPHGTPRRFGQAGEVFPEVQQAENTLETQRARPSA